MKKFLEEFKAFALKGSVIDMAIGVLIGSAFGGIVTSFTENIINPLIALLGDGSTQFGWVIHLGKSDLLIGAFISAVVNFIIMAFIIFCIVKAINKAKDFNKKPVEASAPTTKICPYCKSEIPIEATKCAHCTSDLAE